MEYKLIALDIDGTLLNSSNQITDNVKEAIKKSKEKSLFGLAWFLLWAVPYCNASLLLS